MSIAVVAKYIDGTLFRGTTLNIGAKDTFHLATDKGELKEIKISQLKAVFFLKQKGQTAQPTSFPPHASNLVVRFLDGEEIKGISYDYHVNKDRFFLYPIGNDDSNEKILVNRRATKLVMLRPTVDSAKTYAAPSVQPSDQFKPLEHEIYKILYKLGLEIKQRSLPIDEDFIKSKSIFLKHKLTPLLQAYQNNYSEKNYRELLDSKLQDIQIMFGDKSLGVLNQILNRFTFPSNR